MGKNDWHIDCSNKDTDELLDIIEDALMCESGRSKKCNRALDALKELKRREY